MCRVVEKSVQARFDNLIRIFNRAYKSGTKSARYQLQGVSCKKFDKLLGRPTMDIQVIY